MKLFLHIGGEKTGTTSIQHALRNRRKKLKALGYNLAKTLGQGNHKMLAAYALPYNSQDIAVKSQRGHGDPEAFSAFRQRLERNYSREVKTSDCDYQIVTSEDFHRISTPRSLNLLSTFLTPIFDEIDLIFFVRRQDSLALSRHNTMVEHGYDESFAFTKIADSTIAYYYDFLGIADRWQSAFPKMRIHIVPFGKDSINRGKNSVQLFANLAGIPEETFDGVDDARLNQSHDAVSLHLLQFLRRNTDIGSEDPAFVQCLMQNTLGDDTIIPSNRKTAKAFMARFETSNRKLAQRYCGVSSIFSDSFEQYPEQFEAADVEAYAKRRLLKVALDQFKARSNDAQDT